MAFLVTNNWVNLIRVFPSIFDEDNVDGMCGNPNNNKSDDFIDNLKTEYSKPEDAKICKVNQAVWRYIN